MGRDDDSFYKKRWEIYFDYLDKQLKGEEAIAPDFFQWERDWASGHENIEEQTHTLSIEQIRKIL